MVWTECGVWCSPVVGSCEHINEPSGSITVREFFDWLSDWSGCQERLCSVELLISLWIDIYVDCFILSCTFTGCGLKRYP
jgi:hypothetical protein